MTALTLPTLTNNDSLFRYLEQVRRFPSLDADEEYMLAKRFVEHQDIQAAHQLVTSHLKLVPKIAMTFRGYGLPLLELISEGNIGLMQAVRKFNPELGYRLSTYAMHWIKASIQEYILRSWSLVKLGTTAAQKKLFFNLRKLRNRLEHQLGRPANHEDMQALAKELDVSEADVMSMSTRMSGNDISLDDTLSEDSDSTMLDYLPSESDHEADFAENEELTHKKKLLSQGLGQLNVRERHIIEQRKLQETPATLEQLATFFDISCERVRQIEAAALKKLMQFVQTAV